MAAPIDKLRSNTTENLAVSSSLIHSCVNPWMRLPTDLMIHITQIYLDDQTAHSLCKSSHMLFELIAPRYEWKKSAEWHFSSLPSLVGGIEPLNLKEYTFDHEMDGTLTPILLLRHSISFGRMCGWDALPPHSFQPIHTQDYRAKWSIGIIKSLILNYDDPLDHIQPIHLPHLRFIPTSVMNLNVRKSLLWLPPPEHLMWPKRLNNLHLATCRPEWISLDVKNTWPTTLTEFSFVSCEDWIDPPDPRTIYFPESLAKLTTYGMPLLMYDQPNAWSMPPNLTSLSVNDINLPLDQWRLPKTLTSLDLAGDTHQTGRCWTMPTGLLKLNLGGSWYQSLSTIRFNDHLTSLSLGCDPQDLSTIEFPRSLKELIFGFHFSQPIIGVRLPSGLEVLTLSQQFDYPIYVAPPPPVPKPSCHNISNSPSPTAINPPWCLPPSLRKLTCGWSLKHEFPINKIHLPVLEELTIRGECLAYHTTDEATPAASDQTPPPPSFHSSLVKLITFSTHIRPSVSTVLEQCTRLTTMQCLLIAYDADDSHILTDQIMRQQRFAPNITDLDLHFPRHLPTLLNGVVFPPRLSRLTLSFPYHPPYPLNSPYGFPPRPFAQLQHLTELKFTNQFQESLAHIEFPESLLVLSLPSSYNASLCGLRLPSNLTQLMIGQTDQPSKFCYFDSLMTVLTLVPDSLQDLTIPNPYETRINVLVAGAESSYHPTYKSWVHGLRDRTIACLRIHFTGLE